MDILAALRLKAEQVEVYTSEGESTLVSFEANEIKSAETEEAHGVALRGVVHGRLGFTAAGGEVDDQTLVENLLASAQYGEEVPITFPAATPGPQVETYDPALADVPIKHLVEIGREIVATLLDVDEDAQVYVDIERGVFQSSLHNSAGAQTSERTSSFSVGIGVERVRDDDVLVIEEDISAISLSTDYRPAVQRLAQRLELAKRPARLRSGRMPVLFSPVGGFVLVLPIILATNGKNVQRGISPLSDKLGKAILDEKITLWDDPTLPGRPDSSSYDDEGMPCHRKALLRRGVCETFLYDLKTAALMGTQTTGNGMRSLFSEPSPSESNLVMEAGATPLAEMLAGVEHGLLVDDVLGLDQGNTISGAFSNTVSLAYVIEHGEIVGRVKDVSIAGNVYENLREVAAISQESSWVHSDILMPYILLPELNVVCSG
jgi:PmbA protein